MQEVNRISVRRAAYGKVIGFLFGFIALGLMSYALPKTSWAVRFGTLFYYIVNGLLVGILSLDIEHPVFPMEFKWWITGPLFGGWITFTLILFIGVEYERILTVSQSFMRHFAAPCWLIVEGIIAEWVISIIVYRKVSDLA